MLQLLRKIKSKLTPEPPLPAGAVAELQADRQGLPPGDPGNAAVIDAATKWLCTAQDKSASADGGVARDFSLVKGWATSYPETTGYIIPTIIEMANRTGNADLHARARRMLDWCVAIQRDDGGFMGGKIDATPVVTVTFNTGQILIGLATGARIYGDEPYQKAMHAAAAFLRDNQDEDGCWRKHPTPFAKPGEKAYETHVAWGMFEADRVAPGLGYGESGLRQVDWAITKQQANGWFGSNCLTDAERPLTHTIGYVLRGVLEGHLFSGRTDLLAAAVRTGSSLVDAIGADGYLAGRLDQDFRPSVDYVCLTGSVQIAHCLFILYQLTGEQRYLDAGRRLTKFVRRTVRLDGPRETRGAIKGSFPVDGDYGKWEYLNWAAKFCIDALLLESDLDTARHA
jgi:hypothetical protein